MPPYTQVLSALRKNDLIRLCGEFRLSSDGPVVNLRNRLKDYLNLHRDTLYRNPRYKPLFPKHRKPIQPRQRHDNPSSPPPSPDPSHRSSSRSSSRSYDSWHGIDGHTDRQGSDDLHENPLLFPPHSPPRALNPHLQQLLQQSPEPQPFPANQDPNYLPAPSNDIPNSQRGSMPPATQPIDSCKHPFHRILDVVYSIIFISRSFLSFLDTMKSYIFLFSTVALWASTLFRFSRVHQYQFGCSISDSDDLM